ncbi:MAG: hypothetical protein Q4C45_09980 [Oscillospiraceae bacterium]|nr:hypothetical protein [Oscillospiraceae bacterium]
MIHKTLKKIVSIFLSISIMCICSIPSVFAASPNDFVPPSNGFFADIDPALEEAYRTYSSTAENMDKFVTLSIEDFIFEYENGTYATVSDYLACCIDLLSNCKSLSEVKAQDAMRRAESAALASQADSTREVLLQEWWHNTSDLPRAVTYGTRYNLIGTAIKGDLIFEAAGSGQITGHTVIVAGTYFSSKYNQYYLKSFEAIYSTVCYGILCDERFEDRLSHLDRPTGVDAATMRAALEWAETQEGKPYYLDANPSISQSRPYWYCSLLAYACYYAQGISLCDRVISGLVTPRDIHSGNVRTIRSYTD